LSLEAMEGRLMLANNVVDFASMEELTVTSSFYVHEMRNLDVTELGLESDGMGGFVTRSWHLLNASQDASVFGWRQSLLGGTISVAGEDLNVVPKFNLDFSADFDSNTLPTPGIPILVIAPPANEPSVPEANPSPLVSSAQEGFDDSEGGEIPIQTIIASVGPGATEPIAAAPDGPNDTTGRISLMSSAVDEQRIVGEWARPSMLELAGGEPRSGERQADNPDGEFPDSRTSDDSAELPLSFDHDSPGSAVRLARYGSHDLNAHPSVDGDAKAAAPHRLEVSQTNADVFVEAYGLHNQVQAGSNADVSRDLSGDLPESTEGDLDSERSARSEVFERLGNRELASARIANENDGWGTPLKATSVLMILALERIATGNSRRGNGSPRGASQNRSPRFSATSRQLPPR
jgi:hypothetical protein